MKTKKHNSKNLSISSRIAIATSSAIVFTIIVTVIASSIFSYIAPSFYNFSSVTTNNYSLLNQIQWNQTMITITDQFASNEPDDVKQRSLCRITEHFKDFGTQIYITENGEEFYSNTDEKTITTLAKSISKSDLETKLYSYCDNGLVIVDKYNVNGKEYKIIIANKDYTVTPNAGTNRENITSLLFSKVGFIIILEGLLFIFSIVLMSIITSNIITKPIKELTKGANEIAKGNLDYKIDYDSTNEIGVTANAMNDMTQKLKESIDERNQIDQSRKEMIAGLAHDLRTPLTSVKGYVEGIRDGIANTPEKQEQYIKTIYSSTLDMEKLLNELLDISRLELGKIQLNVEPTNILSFIDEFVEEKMVKIQKYDLDYTYNKPTDIETIMVMLDTDRFSRVLSNIASNSIKYAKPNEKLLIDLTIQNYEKSVIITITDNGIGIDGDNISHIFDTFYRADHARTKTREGSGIGLAVCKEIVSLHGGSIWASSTLNKGTTIHISLEKIKEVNNE